MLTIDLDYLRKYIQKYVYDYYQLKQRPSDEELEIDESTQQWLVPMLQNLVTFYVMRQEVSNIQGTKIYSTKKQKEDCMAARSLNIAKNLSTNKFLLENGKAAKIKEVYAWGAAKNEVHDNIANEFEITRKVASMGLAPKIHDIFICENLKENKVYKIVVSDFVKGMSLREWLDKKPTKEERQHVHDLVKTKLDKLQSHGIIHGAMDSSNIILKMRGKTITDAVVTDFHYSYDILNKKMWDTNRLIKWDRYVLNDILDKPWFVFNTDDVVKYVVARLIKEKKIAVKASS
jgi:serine/threonine protein kinase